MIIKDTKKKLEELGAPRNHYLKGEGEVSSNKSYFEFRGKVYFDSNIPSIKDRQIENPHVNVADSLYAIWNTVHLISSEASRKSTLAGKVLNERVHGTIPADKELDIYTKISDLKQLRGKVFAKYESIISFDGKKLFERSGIGTWELDYKDM